MEHLKSNLLNHTINKIDNLIKFVIKKLFNFYKKVKIKPIKMKKPIQAQFFADKSSKLINNATALNVKKKFQCTPYSLTCSFFIY